VVLVLLLGAVLRGHAAEPPCPEPAQPLPPLAVQPPEQPSGLWQNLVVLHNAYAWHFDGLDLWHEPPPECCLHVFADAGFYFLQPYFESNPVSTFTGHIFTDASIPTTTTRTDEFEYDAGFSPRAEVGVVGNNGFGIRVGWWQFDQVARSRPTTDKDKTGSTLIGSAPVLGVPGFTSPSAAALKFGVFNETLRFATHLKTTVVDTEAVQQTQADVWTLLFSGGVRYTYLSEDYSATRFNAAGSGKSGKTKVFLIEDSDIVAEGHSFAGVGPTVAIDASRPIGTLGFALYGVARTSLLFGTGKIQSYESSRTDVIGSGGVKAKPVAYTNLLFLNDGTERDDLLPVGEVEVGGQWARRLGRVGVFVRVGLVGQAWWGAGNATSENGNLGLFGMTLAGGFDY
jgi:hypothetical protein